jgi:tetratricopeptide (TPR) repeat protein
MSRATRINSRTLWMIALCGALVCGVAIGVCSWLRRDRAAPPIPAPRAIDMARVAEPDAAVIRAVEEARGAVLRAPHSSVAWGGLGMMLLAHGAPAVDSNACFAQAERLNPREPRWPYFQGNSLLESDPEKAIEKLARTTELCADQPDLPRLKLAETLLARGRVDEAAAHFHRCLEAHPGNSRATLGLGRLAYLRGDLRDAQERLSAAAADSRTHKAASALLAEVQHRAGDAEKADRLLAETSQQPDDPAWADPFMAEVGRMEVGRKRSLTIATALMRAHRLKDAITLLSGTLQQYPGSDRLLLLLGLAHNMDEDWKAGEKVLREAVSVAPLAPRIHYNLGMSLAAQKRYAEAAECFETAARLMPNDAMTYFQLARCRIEIADAASAERALRAALDARPAFPDAHRQLGELLEQRASHEEARKHLQQAVALNPRDIAAARLLGEIEATR